MRWCSSRLSTSSSSSLVYRSWFPVPGGSYLPSSMSVRALHAGRRIAPFPVVSTTLRSSELVENENEAKGEENVEENVEDIRGGGGDQERATGARLDPSWRVRAMEMLGAMEDEVWNASNRSWKSAEIRGPWETQTVGGVHGIWPDVVPEAIRARVNLGVQYAPTRTEEPGTLSLMQSGRVAIGNVLTPAQVRQRPRVQYPVDGFRDDARFTLCLVDPDAPSRSDAYWGQWLHWMVCNIPSNRFSEGVESVEYVGSAPPRHSGLHRYIFLLCHQTRGDLDLSKVPRISATDPSGRNNFSFADFALEHGLKVVGLRMYQAEWDQSVVEVYRSLGFEEEPRPIESQDETRERLIRERREHESSQKHRMLRSLMGEIRSPSRQ